MTDLVADTESGKVLVISDQDEDLQNCARTVRVEKEILEFLLRQSGFSLNAAKRRLQDIELNQYERDEYFKKNHIELFIDDTQYKFGFVFSCLSQNRPGYDSFEPLIDCEIQEINLNANVKIILHFAGHVYDPLEFDLQQLFQMKEVEEDIFETEFPIFRICLRNDCIEIMDFRVLRKVPLSLDVLNHDSKIEGKNYAITKKQVQDKLNYDQSVEIQRSLHRRDQLFGYALNHKQVDQLLN